MVTSVLQDKNGSYWFSTHDNGVFYSPNLDIEKVSTPATTAINDQNIFVQKFNAASGIYAGVFASVNGQGDQDRTYDIELNSDAIFTTGKFGNTGQIQFNVALTAASNSYETYFARLSYGGVYYRKGDLAIEQADEKLIDIKIFPNPFTDQVQVEYSSELESQMIVLDASGKQVFDSGRIYPGSFVQQIDLSAYPKGIYMIKINTSEGIETFKLIKQ